MLRRGLTRTCLALLVGLFLLIPGHALAGEAEVTSDVVGLVNRARANEGLPSLATYPDNSQVLRANQHFVQTGQAHALFQESAQFYLDRGATRFGENQAYSADPSRTAGWAVDAWLHSASHRDVMMNPAANYVVVATSCSGAGMHVTMHVVTVPDGARGPATSGTVVGPEDGANCGGAPTSPPPPPPAPSAPPAPTPPPAPPRPDSAPPAAEPAPHDEADAPPVATPAPPEEADPPPRPTGPPVVPPQGARATSGLAPAQVDADLVAAASAPAEEDGAGALDGSMLVVAGLTLAFQSIRRTRKMTGRPR